MIQLKHIYKTYRQGDSKITALKNVELSVADGEFVAIMGDSGSGKTTLMNILGCLDTADRGDYILNSYCINELDHKTLAKIRNRYIGFIFQSFHLFEGISALDNVIMPMIYAGIDKDKREKLARQALEAVGMEKRIRHYPTQLSGGQKQRVAIARALVMRPALILADEPTGNLDSKTSAEIMKLFSLLHQRGSTIILITHDRNVATYAQKLYRLVDGTLHGEAVQ